MKSVKTPLAWQTTDWLASARLGCVFSEMLPCDIVKVITKIILLD